MDDQAQAKLTAATLTLSEGVDALYQALRKQLSIIAEHDHTKIPDGFVPPALMATPQRFQQWQEKLIAGDAESD